MRIEADTDLVETAPGAYEVTGPAVHPDTARRRLRATTTETRLGDDTPVKTTGRDAGLRQVMADALALDARLRRGEVNPWQYGELIGTIQGQLAANLERWGVASDQPEGRLRINSGATHG